jgi:hypothetical protein
MHAPIRLAAYWENAHQVAATGNGSVRRDLLIWGAHGGAGTSTLATLLQPARDMGALHTEADYRYPVPNPDANPVLVACRCTTWSAIKASAAVTALTRSGGQVSVLAVVSDGWPEPPIATSWFRLLSAQVGAVVRLPFIPWLRQCNDPALVRLPRAARQAMDTIRAITSTPGGTRLYLEGEHDVPAASDTRPA